MCIIKECIDNLQIEGFHKRYSVNNVWPIKNVSFFNIFEPKTYNKTRRFDEI